MCRPLSNTAGRGGVCMPGRPGLRALYSSAWASSTPLNAFQAVLSCLHQGASAISWAMGYSLAHSGWCAGALLCPVCSCSGCLPACEGHLIGVADFIWSQAWGLCSHLRVLCAQGIFWKYLSQQITNQQEKTHSQCIRRRQEASPRKPLV